MGGGGVSSVLLVLGSFYFQVSREALPSVPQLPHL